MNIFYGLKNHPYPFYSKIKASKVIKNSCQLQTYYFLTPFQSLGLYLLFDNIKMNIKPYFFNLSYRLKASGWIPLLLKCDVPNVIFPFYHTISDLPLNHIGPLYHVKSVKTFSAELDILLSYFQPIHPSEFYHMILNGERPQKPAFLLSFDDGLSEFYDQIAPVLLAKGIPAINFLNPAFTDNKDMMYRYKISCLAHHHEEYPDAFHQNDVFQLLDIHTSSHVLRKIRQISYADRHLLDTLADITGFSFSEYLSDQQPYLTTEQVKTLAEQGFVFGAHSMDHPHFSQLDMSVQLQQTMASADAVSQMLNQPCHYFSFPFTDAGVSRRFFASLSQSHPELFTFGTAGIKKELLPKHFQRIPMDVYPKGQDIVAGEYIYYLLKHLTGQNTIKRA